MARGGILNRARAAALRLFDRGESPRDLQERNDLCLSLLVATHRKLRMERFGGAVGGEDRSRRLRWEKESREDVAALVDEAASSLEPLHESSLSLKALRYELRRLVGPEVVRIFEAFREVDGRLTPREDLRDDDGGDSGDDDDENGYKFFAGGPWEATVKSILLEECEGVSRSLDEQTAENQLTERKGRRRTDPVPFWTAKRGALLTVLAYHGWPDSSAEAYDIVRENRGNKDGDASLLPDDFGFYPQHADADTIHAIRYHQALNLARSALLRDLLGYSVVALRSNVPEAGRGVYIDGRAPAGSLLAFFPGQVWPKEHLLGRSAQSHFSNDPNLHLSMRYDNILIDSRGSPYTVLNGAGKSNPFALAHVVNHPIAGSPRNCFTAPLEYTEAMDLAVDELDRYVPNTYARPPRFLSAASALDRDQIRMHGLGLMAARDVEDEELFYDYRLSPGTEEGGSYPQWYHACDEEELKNRWHNDNEEE